MSSATLTAIQNSIVFNGYPTFMSLGYIGNILIIIIFARQHQNACSIFLISSAIANLTYLSFNCFTQLFPFYYRDETVRAFILCKIRFYFGNVFGQSARILVVAAALDRFMYTSNRANFRALSTPKQAKWWVFGIVIFWPIFACHIPIMVTIVNGQCGTFGTYSIIYTIYLILFVGLVPSIMVAVLGYLTYRHITQLRNRVQPIISSTINQANTNIRRRDRTLLILVMSESTVYFITTIPYSFINLEILVSKSVLTNKSAQYSQIETFINAVAFLILYINNAIPFYIYLITSGTFRQDVKQLFVDIYRKPTRQPAAVRTNNARRTILTKTQRETHN
ncbi:unnamed protein product [Adineta ricciae]|uniref:G-protein coupled receptors family 1 profile domain-containing protein n=1 Tax=Adineta ricciae TaxID=249248 RepID=A0A816ENR0_ADIRI|nr:unnamed protein product [Adineta ricciae]CAF1651757.1 unnamed protein product [Adineta ricciae]